MAAVIPGDVYLTPVLDSVPRLLGLMNRNISSRSFGCFDREYWHYNTTDFSCARKQEAVLTLALLYLTENEQNRYYQNREILCYIRAALMFWTKIQNKNGSFNEWYPNENSFVVTSFSAYAVSESLLLMKDELPVDEYRSVSASLVKAGDWLTGRNETRVMNQQTGAAAALLNIYLLTKESKYLTSSEDKLSLLYQRQSEEGWFLEYGGPDIGYLSLAIDYLSKYYGKTRNPLAQKLITRALGFIKYFIQPGFVAGGEYTSRNTEYLIPHGFEIFSKTNDDARFIASAIRKSLLKRNSFPRLFDDRYLTYVGYTWLQAYRDVNPELDTSAEDIVDSHFNRQFRRFFNKSALLIVNDPRKHVIINVNKGGSFRLYDKGTGQTYSDSGILVKSDSKWYTSGWLSDSQADMTEETVVLAGTMWQVPDKTMSPLHTILLRLFQMTFGRSSVISLWLKERLRDVLISKTKPSHVRYTREMTLRDNTDELLSIRDSVSSDRASISSFAVFAKDTHIYVPSSRYYVDMKNPPIEKAFSPPVDTAEINWKIPA